MHRKSDTAGLNDALDGIFREEFTPTIRKTCRQSRQPLLRNSLFYSLGRSDVHAEGLEFGRKKTCGMPSMQHHFCLRL